ncbi:uncharacterized protein LOC111322024 [Stylophora pistillata]|uniref:uncharacterized protein LOC111322024 n=1 Tax=Stylophora pistillata TaxID=50429 RepID=UPI000C05603C|nr:uncharacterized protein LOC111322024 [Stylophora pistillata]
MKLLLFCILSTSLVCSRVKATLQRDVITYMNVFRHLHAAGPLLVDDVLQKNAQNAAMLFMKAKSKDNVPIYRYSANFCKYKGSVVDLDKTCVTSWYVSMKYYVWCYPKAEGQALPFVNMIWKSSTKAGVGIAKDTDGTYYVVVYIALQDENNLLRNVPPVKTVMEASPKAKCPAGYSRYETSCFKYETTAVTWDEAVTRCARENATLASIRNAKEEEFVRGLQKKTGSGVETWIGLHDSLHEGSFKWFDGLKFKSHVCVPVNANGGNLENCVAWSINKPKGCWDDRPCNEKRPFTCRIPVEGKSTYRTEVLFKKFRWRANYKDKNSKAYRDLVNGIRITFKEIFTRMSGKKKGGFRTVKVKGVRAVSFKGRPAGLGITVSIKFRSFTPDPTLRFQKFLRPSEKLLSMTIDRPDKVEGHTGKAGGYCYGSCNNHGRCTASLHPNSYQLGLPAPAYTVYYPGVQRVTGTSDPYPASCPMTCSQYPTLDCYMQCNDECCDSREGKRNWKAKAIEDLMRERFKTQNQFTDDERNQTKFESNDSEDKDVDLQPNSTESHDKVNDSKNIIEDLKKKIKRLQRRLKKKHQPEKVDYFDDINDSPKPEVDHVINPPNKTEQSRDDDEEKQLDAIAHDLTDDVHDPRDVPEGNMHNKPELTKTNITKKEITHNPEESFGQKEKYTSSLPDDDDNEEISLDNQRVKIGFQGDSISNQNDSIEKKGISTENHDRKSTFRTIDKTSNLKYQNDYMVKERQNTMKTVQHANISVKEELINKEKTAKLHDPINVYEPGNTMTEESIDEEGEGDSSESELPGEQGLFSLQDSALDPTEEILDEEGIDDVGKFGRKRNLIHKKKSSYTGK